MCVPTCHLPYPGRPSGCTWLLLPHPYKPSPYPYRLGICVPHVFQSHVAVFRGCKVRLMLRPAGWLALHWPGLVRSSFHLRSHLPETSSMLRGLTANSRGRTCTGNTRSIVGCARISRKLPDQTSGRRLLAIPTVSPTTEKVGFCLDALPRCAEPAPTRSRSGFYPCNP
jgi:hypothetical protein